MSDPLSAEPMSEETLALCEKVARIAGSGASDIAIIDLSGRILALCEEVKRLRAAVEGRVDLEREQCAQVAEFWGECGECGSAVTLHDIASAIRARSRGEVKP